MHSASLRGQVFGLRNAGNSYAHISSLTGISKSTLSDWLSKIPYTPNRETISRIGKARAAAGARKVAIKQESFLRARAKARKEIGKVSTRDLFMFGLGLYLGEGSKTHDCVRVSNSDPAVIQLAIEWFQSLGVTREQLFLCIHLYPDNDPEKSLQFWSRTTSIPRSQFGKIQVDRRTNKKAFRAGKSLYGTAHLSVRSRGRPEFGVFFSRKILAEIEEVIRQNTARA